MTFENENPFALRSTLEYEMPDFSRINDESYRPAFYAGCEEQLGEVAAITAQLHRVCSDTIGLGHGIDLVCPVGQRPEEIVNRNEHHTNHNQPMIPLLRKH
jgi:hypothetical protein